jgi:glycosyltransferase involved in cell wall biosynthesis
MRNKNNSLISIIIPARNASKYIKEAILSVQKQDTIKDIEIIVVDDGSTDNSGAIAEELGCKVFRIPASGASKARNIGLQKAQGSLVLFHDADDVMEPDAISLMNEELDKTTEIQAVFAMRKDFISPELTEEERKDISENRDAYFGAIAGCALIKREVFDIAGEFDESLQIGDALAWQMKLQDLSIKVKTIPYLAVNRRLHNNNLGRTSKTQQFKDYSIVFREKFRKK